MTSSDTILTIAERLSLIERTARAAGYFGARAYIVVRGENHSASGVVAGVAGVIVDGVGARGYFYGPDCLDKAMAWASALKPPYETEMAAWFTVEPVAAQAEEAAR